MYYECDVCISTCFIDSEVLGLASSLSRATREGGEKKPLECVYPHLITSVRYRWGRAFVS